MMRAYGVDMTQAEFAQKVIKLRGQIGELYKGIRHHVMHVLGLTIKNVTERREPVLSDQLLWCPILNSSLNQHLAWHKDHRVSRNRRRANGKRAYRIAHSGRRRGWAHDADG